MEQEKSNLPATANAMPPEVVDEIESVENEFSPPVAVAGAEGNMAVAAIREAAEVQGMIAAAKRFPRDQFTAMKNIMENCERFTLAKQSNYAFPRGDKTVTGPTIRLAEMEAQCWGNLDYGIVELEQRKGESVMQAYCWDLQTNVRRKINFTVRHERHTKERNYKLDDPRDIYELTANQGARRVRACILAVIPGDVTEKALSQCKKTLLEGDKKKPMKERIAETIFFFSKVGVPKLAIEKRLKHSIESIDKEELYELIGIYNSIHDNTANRRDFFDLEGAPTETAANIAEKIKAGSTGSAQSPESGKGAPGLRVEKGSKKETGPSQKELDDLAAKQQ